MAEKEYPNVEDDLYLRIRSTLHREWSRSLIGYPWSLDRNIIWHCLERERLGLSYVLPIAWQKLLFLSNAPSDVVAQLGEESHLTKEEFDEFLFVVRNLGFERDPVVVAPTLFEEEQEVEEEEVEKGVPSKLILVHGGSRWRLLAGAAAACLIAAFLGGSWIGQSSRTSLQQALASEAEARKQVEQQLTVASKNLDSAEDRARRMGAQVTSLTEEAEKLRVALREARGANTELQREAKDRAGLVESLREDLRNQRKPSGVVASVARPGGLTRPLEVVLKDRGRDASPKDQLFDFAPSLTSVVENQPLLSWKLTTIYPLTVKLLQGQAVVWSKDLPAGTSAVKVDKGLRRGAMYEWVITTEDPNLPEPSRRAFYVLSSSEESQFQGAMRRAATPLQKAAVYERFGLLQDLLKLGTPFDELAREAMRRQNRS